MIDQDLGWELTWNDVFDNFIRFPFNKSSSSCNLTVEKSFSDRDLLNADDFMIIFADTTNLTRWNVK